MAFELEVLAITQLSDEFIGLAIAALALQAEKRTSSKKYGPRGAGWVHTAQSSECCHFLRGWAGTTAANHRWDSDRMTQVLYD